MALHCFAGGLFYLILPKFEAILRDFRLPLPPLTRSMIDLSRALFGSQGVAMFPIAFVEFVVLFALPFLLFGWLEHGIPLIDRLFISRHAPPVLRALAWVVDGGRPLLWGVRALAKWYPRRGSGAG